MLAFTVLVPLLLISAAWCNPVPRRRNWQVNNISPILQPPPSTTHTTFWCYLPILASLFCPQARQSSSGSSVTTPLGTAQGVTDGSGVHRFAVRYASADRWKTSTVATSWELPNNSSDTSALPLTCPQPNADDSTFSEDCLSMILYVPDTLSSGTDAPTLMWVHGGSFIIGSATDPGLDGSNFAVAASSIVAVVQYRLGALGLMAPSGATNLGLEDLMNALAFLHMVVPSFGGDSSMITVAGQSSGANMIRALLAVPSADALFQSAILQSDPMDYGFLSAGAQQTLQNYYNTQIGCAGTDTGCQDALSLDAIINAQQALYNDAYTLDPSATQSEPIRVVHDGMLITSTLDSSSSFPSVSKPLLISTVLNEAGYTIYGAIGSTLAESNFEPVVNETFGSVRTNKIMASSLYTASGSVSANSTSTSDVDARAQLQTLGTDYLWKCSSWTFSRNWVGNGGSAYVGVYVLGASYPGNSDVQYCMQDGVVCHQDDIEIVFGTVPSPTSAQSALIQEMQARYGAFMRTGNPNPSGSSYATWQAVGTTDVNAIQLGGSGLAPVGACDPSVWGDELQYDYQVYGI